MNFLEQLVAEWYGYRDYFIRTNVKFGKRSKGGYTGEVDVLAVKPQERELIHVEASMDAYSWPKRREVFDRKFHKVQTHYQKLVGFEPDQDRIQRIALVGLNRTYPVEHFEGAGFEILLIPDFVAELVEYLDKKHPLREAVPETYPLLRALQFGAFARRTGATSP